MNIDNSTAELRANLAELVRASQALVIATSYESDPKWARSAALATELALARFDAIDSSFAWYAGAAEFAQDELQVFHTEPNGSVPGYLVVKREESCEREADGRVVEAGTRIWFNVASPRRAFEQGSACAAYYSHCDGIEVVSFYVSELDRLLGGSDTEEGAVFASHLMNALLEWAQRWPNARLAPIPPPALPFLANIPNRRAFYRSFGLQLIGDEKPSDGTSHAAAKSDGTAYKPLQRKPLHISLYCLLRQTQLAFDRNRQLEAKLARQSAHQGAIGRARSLALLFATTLAVLVTAFLRFHH